MNRPFYQYSLKLLLLVSCLAGITANALPPQLYHQGSYESPVRGDPDDLLILAGYGLDVGDEVVYQAVDISSPLGHPVNIPAHATAKLGRAEIVSKGNVPYALTIKLPPQIGIDQTYALWVHTAAGEWSEPIKINDARPLWMSPAFVYTTRAVAGLPREIKVIGRNLQPSSGLSTRIRLIGPRTITGNSIIDEKSSTTIDHYVARLKLPRSLEPGRYRIQVSRDGINWAEVIGQTFEVRPDLPAPIEYSVGDPQFGGCRPDDDADDTECILRAIAAAQRAGGGTLYFGPGTWDLVDATQTGVNLYDGIIVPRGIRLRGAGSELTRLVRRKKWNIQTHPPAFTFAGNTVVTGFHFEDAERYEPGDRAGPFLQVGENFQRVAADKTLPAAAAVASDIVITRNVFDKTFIAIGEGGLPIERLFVTYNTFGAYYSDLALSGNRFNMIYPYQITDSIIDHNVFKPSSRLDVVGKSGSIATELGAGRRVDFSGNIADGASTEYLYSPEDPSGWRAAFFWSLNGNVEETLVSQNLATCTGDKIGDGEGVAYDNNGNTFAFRSVVDISNASPTSLEVLELLNSRQNDRDIPLRTYYVGHWIQVASGPGLGEIRRITGYSTDPVTGHSTFRVAPAWDVVPVPFKSRIAIGREFWQVYTLDNRIDHRQPLCRKSNRSRHHAGVIGVWAQAADSVIEGNRQFDTDGILLQEAYVLPEHACANCGMESFFQSFLEIRANTVDGEYAWNTDCSSSGILVGAAAAPWNDTAPPTMGFGISISHNIVTHADADRGGAIGQIDSWWAGPEPHRWPLSDNLLIHHNSISEIEGDPPLPVCGKSKPRIGINFPQPEIAWHTVLYANSCVNVSTPISGRGVGIVRVCPSSATVATSCECSSSRDLSDGSVQH